MDKGNSEEKKISITFTQISNLMLTVFLAGAILSPFAGYCSSSGSFVEAQGENPLEKSDSVKSALTVQQAIREIYREVNPAVVRIETEQKVVVNHPFMNDPFFRRFFGDQMENQEQRRTGLGSGFIISKEGYIVTNQHVVNKVDKITVKLVNGKSYPAKLIGSDSVSDLALLKIDSVKGLKVVHLGDSDKIEVGDFAIAIGNPFGLSSTFTLGVVSSRGQEVTADGVGRIQTDAAINPGNSGGPLLNIKGEVIGINQMIVSPSGGSSGIGFAIPINYGMEIVEKLRSGKSIKAGYIGVQIHPEPSEEQLKELGYNNKKGLLVHQVVPGSPAWKAGIRQYDFITEIDGKPAESFNQLKSAVLRKGIGSAIELKVLRADEKRTVAVTVAEIPNSG